MSTGKKAAKKVVSGLSTAGSGSRGGAGRAPLRAQPSFALGPPTGSARKEARPHQESDLCQCWARFSSSCKQGIS